MKDWRRLMRRARDSRDKPMKPQVVARELGLRLRRRRDRLRATAAPSPPGGPATSRRGAGRCTRCRATSPAWPTRFPTRSRRRSRIPERQVRGLRRRRRLLDVDGRVRDLREVSAAREGGGREEQHAGADQVGADGLPRQSRVRRASSTRSTSPPSPRPAEAPASRSRTRPSAATPSTPRSRPPGRWSSRPWWIRSSRRCPPR